MAKLYSLDLRERVAAFAIAHTSANLAAQTFSVSKATAVRWAKQLRDTGNVAIGDVGGHKPVILRRERDWLMQRITDEPHVALRKLLSELAARGTVVSYGTLWNFVHNEDLSFKKTVHAAEQRRPDVARRRYWWQKYQTRIDTSRLVFIDEAWVKANMAPLRGGSRKASA